MVAWPGCEPAATPVATTVVNVEEIVRGMRASEAGAVQRLCAGLVVLPLDEPAAWLAGTWRRSFAARGVTLFQADCLLAAVTVTRQGQLCTGSPKDFPMTDVAVDHWPVGRRATADTAV